jgi:hypothetical protein
VVNQRAIKHAGFVPEIAPAATHKNQTWADPVDLIVHVDFTNTYVRHDQAFPVTLWLS